jgi:dephospho-CoA kinase
MKMIGLVGGVASGKSAVANLLENLGAGLLDADRSGHAVLAEDGEVRDALRRRWGDAIFLPDGTVDRAAIARVVFAGGAQANGERQFLEQILHPRIRQRIETQRRQFALAGRPAVVLDAPLLLEAGWGPMCDVILMVDASREVRLARAQHRGWTEDHFNQREAAQWPVEEKRRSADVVIKNDGTEDELREAVRDFWQRHVVLVDTP